MRFLFSRLTIAHGRVPAALERIEAWYRQDERRGRLLGCFVSEIGQLNCIAILENLPAAESVLAEAQANVAARPWDLAEDLLAFDAQIYAPFPCSPPIVTGERGAFYEIRCYDLKPGTLTGTFDVWAKSLPERLKFSPIVGVLYAVSGVQPRMLHIWPYKDLNERTHARGAAARSGHWPPPGGAARTTSMRNEIFVPASFSPLR